MDIRKLLITGLFATAIVFGTTALVRGVVGLRHDGVAYFNMTNSSLRATASVQPAPGTVETAASPQPKVAASAAPTKTAVTKTATANPPKSPSPQPSAKMKASPKPVAKVTTTRVPSPQPSTHAVAHQANPQPSTHPKTVVVAQTTFTKSGQGKVLTAYTAAKPAKAQHLSVTLPATGPGIGSLIGVPALVGTGVWYWRTRRRG